MPGSKIGPFSVVVPRVDDDVWARDPAGRRALVALGSPVALGAEARAMAALRGKLEVPAVLEEGDDPRVGSYLALDGGREDGVPLEEAVRGGSVSKVTMLVEELFRVLSVIEEAGYAWSPRERDLFVLGAEDDPRIGVRRLRGAARLGHHGRIDARAILDELAPALVSDPAATLPPQLVRALFGRDRASVEDARAIEAVRAAIDRALEASVISIASHVGDASLDAISDLGLLRDRHEDAVATAHGGSWAAIAVCDGVSASYRSDLASRLAADRVCARLSAEMATDDAVALMRRAIREAHDAICEARRAGDDAAGTTVVAVLAVDRTITVGWVGDSRAYWIGAGGDVILTRDHSWLNDVLASGALTVDEAIVSPHAHALTRCLGPLEGGDPAFHAEPDVYPFTAPGPGWLVLCSDGFWNYFPSADEIAELIKLAGADAGADRIARVLVHAALSRGGHDNVTVAVFAVR